MKQLGDFDQFSRDYRQIHNKNIRISGADSDYFSEQKVIEVAKRERGKNPRKILDFGCGDGNSLKHFVNYFPESNFFGSDISKESIDVVMERRLPRTIAKHFDGQQLQFRAQSFDIIFVANVFHHINKTFHSSIIKELYRVLKDGGRLYIFEHNPSNPLTRKVFKDCIFDGEAKMLHNRYLVRSLKEAGFSQLRVTYTLFFPRHKIFRKALFVEKFLEKIPFGAQYYITTIK